MNEEMISQMLEKLRECGVDVEACNPGGKGFAAMKIVCVPSGLGEGLTSLEGASRDHVVMARVESDTLAKLDSWVEAGAVKSRSAAAALFIREGLKVREKELSELEGALADVDAAKARLHQKAKAVLELEELKEEE